MSKVFPHATRQNPCPICGKPDYCQFGEKAILCQRIESTHPNTGKSGGWWHFYDEKKVFRPRAPMPQRKSAETEIDCEAILASCTHGTNWKLAESLGVSIDSLNALNVVWSIKAMAWFFPMRDGAGNIIGIRTRNQAGEKKAVLGSKQGIFIPDEELKQPVAYGIEGPTDSAALITMGLFPIGRPNNICGGDMIRDAMRRMNIWRMVIVADNDELKHGKRAGIEGAERLKKELKEFSTCIWIPPSPIKDARELLQRIGPDASRRLIESDVAKKVWTKG